jgi:D-sedoheptulose 7-phosphate isomerase
MTSKNNMVEEIQQTFAESIAVKQKSLERLTDTIADIAEVIVESLSNGGKLLLCGNGGSAADAQHIAAEFICRFVRNRQALPAIALTTDTSIITAAGNDFSFDEVFSRQVDALGTPGDVLLAISTSGNSPNVIKAVESAKRNRVTVIGFTGESGGKLRDICDICLCVPSTVTARIQEVHITAAHAICSIAEKRLTL